MLGNNIFRFVGIGDFKKEIYVMFPFSSVRY